MEQQNSRGLFLTLEGGEGAGKTTAMNTIRDYLDAAEIPVVFTREPGGTPLSEKIRALLIDRAYPDMNSMTELLLFFAARAEHVDKVIRPAIAQGKWVVSDRFTDASYAYQGGGRGIPRDFIQMLESWVIYDFQPDQTFLFDLPVQTGITRVDGRGKKDRIEMEKNDFLERVRQAYLKRARDFPERFTLIDAEQSMDAVNDQLLNALGALVHA